MDGEIIGVIIIVAILLIFPGVLIYKAFNQGMFSPETVTFFGNVTDTELTGQRSPSTMVELDYNTTIKFPGHHIFTIGECYYITLIIKRNTYELKDAKVVGD